MQWICAVDASLSLEYVSNFFSALEYHLFSSCIIFLYLFILYIFEARTCKEQVDEKEEEKYREMLSN